jgi:hypothetical protein
MSLILQLPILIFPCAKGHMMYLLWFNFLQNDWQPKNVIIDLFEVTKNTTHALVQSMIDLLENNGPRKKSLPMLRMKGLTSM